MPKLQDVLDKELEIYFSKNKDNVIQKNIDASVNIGKSELEEYKTKLIKNITYELKKNRKKNSILLVLISIVVITLSSLMMYSVQSSGLEQIKSEINDLKLKVNISRKITSEIDTMPENLRLNILSQKVAEIDNLVNPNNKLLLENIHFKENFYSEQKVINNKIEIINDQLNKMHSFYITLLTVFLAFMMLIVAWMLNKLFIKTD